MSSDISVFPKTYLPIFLSWCTLQWSIAPLLVPTAVKDFYNDHIKPLLLPGHMTSFIFAPKLRDNGLIAH